MSRRAEPIFLADQERPTLRMWARARSQPQRVVQRAQIVLLAAEGVESLEIAHHLRVSRPTVQLWRGRFLALRTAGLERDAPRPGRIPALSDQKRAAILEAAMHSTPPNATHWSTRLMAKAQGVSEATVRRIWKQHGLRPHRVSTFKVSRDPRFAEKLTDVVGLYLNPPDRALVLCVDEKSQIQALDRTQPGLPLRPGRCGTMTHDYTRHGVTTLFAALNTLDGAVIGDCMPQHRHQEFTRFLKRIDQQTPSELDMHLIVDNYGTHKHASVTAWLRRHPRFHLHFTPTSSSWLNLVERWFRDLSEKRIRRESFESVPDLIATIEDYLKQSNQNPHIFVWTAPAERILAKIAKCKEALDALH
ncbi:MAG: IS630 family transposase [Terriglobia bacterium]